MILSPYSFWELTALIFDTWIVSAFWILAIGITWGFGKFLIGDDE